MAPVPQSFSPEFIDELLKSPIIEVSPDSVMELMPQPPHNANIPRARAGATGHNFRQHAENTPRRRQHVVPIHERIYRDNYDEDCDVLFGRGGLTINHHGDMSFLEEARRVWHQEWQFLDRAHDQGRMNELKTELYNWVLARGGKFLIKEDNETKIAMLKLETGSTSDTWWYEAHPMKAIRRCSQAIRESSNRR